MREKIRKKLQEAREKDVSEHIQEHRKIFITITDYIGRHLLSSFLVMVILTIITIMTSFWNITAFLIASVILSLYALLYAIALLRKGIHVLFDNQGKLYQLILGYGIAVIGILFFFATLYGITNELEKGYLTYDSCSSKKVTPEMIASDIQSVDGIGERFYFSASTFFTVGYGDICPMGWDKIIAIINGASGVVFSTIILGIAIAKYVEHHR